MALVKPHVNFKHHSCNKPSSKTKKTLSLKIEEMDSPDNGFVGLAFDELSSNVDSLAGTFDLLDV